MAELQTISAAFDVLKIVWAACVFFKKVKDADKTAADFYERITCLRGTLEDVQTIAKKRSVADVAAEDDNDRRKFQRMEACITASGNVISDIQRKIGGFGSSGDKSSVSTLVERFKVALRQSSLEKCDTALKARINTLQTDLMLLQLSTGEMLSTKIDDLGTRQKEFLDRITQLETQISKNQKFIADVFFSQRREIGRSSQKAKSSSMVTAALEDNDAIDSLMDCQRFAEDEYERYSSAYIPDNRSIRQRKVLASEFDQSSPGIKTPPPESEAGTLASVSHVSIPHVEPDLEESTDEDEDNVDAWAPQDLTGFISGHLEQAERESDAQRYHTAERSLQTAIKYSEDRLRIHGIAFDNRVELQEDAAILYQKQQKWAEAISTVHQLLRESSVSPPQVATRAVSDELAQARQNQLLANIHMARHNSQSDSSTHQVSDDLEKAEKHARKAFNKMRALQEGTDLLQKDRERYNLCLILLVDILRARDKMVEAQQMSKFLTTSSEAEVESLRRLSTTRPNDIVLVDDQHGLLIEAIKSGNRDEIQVLLEGKDLDVERVTQGKTLLMVAVECSDETTLMRLLAADIGADVNGCNAQGTTALHHAATLGEHTLLHLLLSHDAKVDQRDRRGDTALVKAVQHNKRACIETLCESKANFKIQNVDQWSALHFAVRQPHTSVTKQLLDLSPELGHAADRAGKTALHHCAELNFIQQAAALLQHKSPPDVNAVESANRTALCIVANGPFTQEREDFVNLLLRHGADPSVGKEQPRYRNYAALKPHLAEVRKASKVRKASTISHDSVSTTGSIGTASTDMSKISRVWSSRVPWHR